MLSLSRDSHREGSGFVGTGSWLLMMPQKPDLGGNSILIKMESSLAALSLR